MKLEAYILFGIAEIYFDEIPAILNPRIRHFDEELGYGECTFSFKNSELYEVFREHHLNIVYCKKYPGIFNFADHFLYGHWSELPQGVTKKEDWKYEIDIENDADIQNLYEDPKFRELNGRYAKEAEEDRARILKELEAEELEACDSEPKLEDFNEKNSEIKKFGELGEETSPNSSNILVESDSNNL
jgi:hypothetical protein